MRMFLISSPKSQIFIFRFLKHTKITSVKFTLSIARSQIHEMKIISLKHRKYAKKSINFCLETCFHSKCECRQVGGDWSVEFPSRFSLHTSSRAHYTWSFIGSKDFLYRRRSSLSSHFIFNLAFDSVRRVSRITIKRLIKHIQPSGVII
jgi:hypothetical protein